MDKVQLLKRLETAASEILANGGCITKAEADEMFADLELDERHKELIYAYLDEHDIEVEGFVKQGFKTDKEAKEEVSDNIEKSDESDVKDEKDISDGSNEKDGVNESKFLDMYLDDLAMIERLAVSEEQALYVGIIEGDEAARKRLSEGMLHDVVDIAKGYIKRAGKVSVEELIEEGNIGLISGINDIFASKKKTDVKEYLNESIRLAIERLIDDTMQTKDWETAVIAKTTLLHEASKYLAEELGRIATIEELSQYTKMDSDEIREILGLSLDSVKVGTGDIR